MVEHQGESVVPMTILFESDYRSGNGGEDLSCETLTKMLVTCIWNFSWLATDEAKWEPVILLLVCTAIGVIL